MWLWERLECISFPPGSSNLKVIYILFPMLVLPSRLLNSYRKWLMSNCRRTWGGIEWGGVGWGDIGDLGRSCIVVISASSWGQAIVSQVQRKYNTNISDADEGLIMHASRLQFTTNSQGQPAWNMSQPLRCKILSLFEASPSDLKNWDL